MKAGKEKRKQSSYFLFKMLFSNIWISDVDLMCFLILFPRVSFYACHICSQFKSAKFYIHALFREIVLLYLCSITLPSFSQIYWVGPIIGAVLAGGLYEYVFCPDVELKRRFKEAFSKAAQQTKGSYMEVEDNRSQVETDDLILKPGVVHVIDIDRGEEKKGKDPSGEVLSSV